MSQSQTETEDVEQHGLVLDYDKVTGEALVIVDSGISARLKEHQRHGIQFMWNNCYESLERSASQGTGCILAHCMGLGKTFQVIALIHTLFKYPETKTSHVLVVCPLSTVANWVNEFTIAADVVQDTETEVLVHAVKERTNKSGKYVVVRRWRSMKGVLIMGYDTFVSLVKERRDKPDDPDVKYAHFVLHNPGERFYPYFFFYSKY